MQGADGKHKMGNIFANQSHIRRHFSFRRRVFLITYMKSREANENEKMAVLCMGLERLAEWLGYEMEEESAGEIM